MIPKFTPAKRAAVLTLVVVFAVGLGVGLVILGRTSVAEPTAQQANPEKQLALKFYAADFLAQDPAGAWDMMHPLHQKGWGGSRDGYLAAKKMHRRVETPRQIQVQEWRRPQERAVTFLIRSAIKDPVVIVVSESEDGALSVIDGRYWEGEPLP